MPPVGSRGRYIEIMLPVEGRCEYMKLCHLSRAGVNILKLRHLSTRAGGEYIEIIPPVEGRGEFIEIAPPVNEGRGKYIEIIPPVESRCEIKYWNYATCQRGEG
jgi:hypothetical protein